MSQTESPSERLRQQRRELLLDLAKQAEARKHQVQQLLAQCAGERDKEAERLRGSRRDTLQKISAEVKEMRESSQKSGSVEVVPDPAVVPAVVPAAPSAVPSALAIMPAPSPTPPPSPIPPPSPTPPSPPAPPRVASLRAPTPVLSIEAPSVSSEDPSPTRSAIAPSVSPSRPDAEAAFELRMSGLEDAFAKLVQTVTEKLDYSARIQTLETHCRDLRHSIEELGAKFHPVENKCDVLRNDLRSVELSGDRLADQVKSFDQLFASLGRDSQKLNSLVDSLAGELRQIQARVVSSENAQSALAAEKTAEVTSLQDRLGRLESGLVRAIGLLQSSEQGIADLSNLRERFLDMESGFQRVLRAVDSLQKPPEVTDTAAEREATANVLASLTKLVQGMRAAQNERQIQTHTGAKSA